MKLLMILYMEPYRLVLYSHQTTGIFICTIVRIPCVVFEEKKPTSFGGLCYRTLYCFYISWRI